MSAPEWKPGDVAMVECSDDNWRPAFYVPGDRWDNWRFADGMLRDALLSKSRPLVVIDPESAEDVERLTRIIFGPLASAAGDMAGYLREFATPTPPKPDEPQGLGAVVEDAEGDRYVRRADSCQPVWVHAEGVVM